MSRLFYVRRKRHSREKNLTFDRALNYNREFHFKQRGEVPWPNTAGPRMASKVKDRRPGEGACKDARREEQEVHSG